VVLLALVEALAPWTGERLLLLDLVDNGRRSPFPDVDLSRTVGWLSYRYPLLLDLRDAAGPADALRVVADRVARVAGRGMDYGVLRYMSDDEELRSRLLPLPEVVVHYTIRRTVPQSGGVALPLSERALDRWADPEMRWPHPLYVRVERAGTYLEWRLMYSANLHRRSTMERLSERIGEVLRSLATLSGETSA
jgi:hypothetical protein